VAIEPIESILNKIMRRYDGRPTDWNVLIDYKGNVLVLGPKEGYMLKMVSINPEKQIGVGIKLDSPNEMRRLVDGGPSWGFRPLSAIHTKELLNGFRHAEKRKGLVSEILKRKPVSTLELKRKRPKAVLSGPFIRYPDLSDISTSQKELELKLKIEAEKLFRKKYPYRATIYR
jgi:hypothetical protein